jgi:hypothetical protein
MARVYEATTPRGPASVCTTRRLGVLAVVTTVTQPTDLSGSKAVRR